MTHSSVFKLAFILTGGLCAKQTQTATQIQLVARDGLYHFVLFSFSFSACGRRLQGRQAMSAGCFRAILCAGLSTGHGHFLKHLWSPPADMCCFAFCHRAPAEPDCCKSPKQQLKIKKGNLQIGVILCSRSVSRLLLVLTNVSANFSAHSRSSSICTSACSHGAPG